MYTKGWLVLFTVVVTSAWTLLHPTPRRDNDSALVLEGLAFHDNSTTSPFKNTSSIGFSGYDSPLVSNAEPKCDGRAYGNDLDRISCFDAWSSIGLDKEPIVWERRGSGVYGNPKLPFRFSSGQ